MKKRFIPITVILLAALSVGAFCVLNDSAFSLPIHKDKWTLWQKPSFFRGAAVHPYNPFSDSSEESTFVQKDDFLSLRKHGANVVALNYPGPFRADPPYALDVEKLKWLDDAIGWAGEAGLYVIIHFRNGPGKPDTSFAGGEDETIWHSPAAMDKWVDMWRFVAARYKNRPHVVGYDLMVEPHPELPVKQPELPASAWFELAQRITAAIRQVDQETPIIVSGAAWSNPLSMEELKPTGDPRTIYSFHMYEPFHFTHQGLEWAGTGHISGLLYPGTIPSDIYEETRFWDKNLLKDVLRHARNFQLQYRTPIFVGEFGCNRRIESCNAYLDDLLSIFEEYGWSHTFFVWKDGGDMVDGDFDYEKEPGGGQRVLESQTLKLFKSRWRHNEFAEPLVQAIAPPEPALPGAGLKDLAAKRGLEFGAFYQHDIRDGAHDRIFPQEFNLMAAGFFWNGGFRPSRDQYDFASFDEDVAFGIQHGMQIHGHTLIWFEEVPDWIKAMPNAQVETVMNEHIDTVVGRHAGKIALWDVVNEAVNDDGTIRQNHKWAEAMGTEYIRKAFLRAHRADPKAILRLNEFDIESNEAKFMGVKNLLKGLLAQGVPVNALGWQMHVQPGSFDPDTLLERMNEIADLGLDNYISELDVEIPPEATDRDYEQQKQTYKMAVQTFLAARRHKTIVVWGLRDGDPNWLTDAHPLLWDENLQKKPAYDGVREALLKR